MARLFIAFLPFVLTSIRARERTPTRAICGATSYPYPPSCTNAPLTAQCEGPSETPGPPTCGGLRAEAPERTVAQPLGIALAILGQLDDGLRERRRPRLFAVGQAEPGQPGPA